MDYLANISNEAKERMLQDNALAFDPHALDGNPQAKRKWNVPKSQLPSYLLRDPILWKFFKRLHYEDKNFLCIVVGETGAGKSQTAITLARAIDITPLGNGKAKTNFVVADDGKGIPVPECRVVFGAGEFMRLIKSGLPKGSIIVWDEAGVGNDATRWYDKKSQLIKHIMQTFRSRNYGVFMTVPDKESIAIGTRRLVHCYMDVYNREADHVEVLINWIQRNRKTGMQYEKCPVYEDPETGKLKKVICYKVPAPNREVERAYNRIKNRTLQNMYKFYQNEMDIMERELGMKDSSSTGEQQEVKLRKFNMNTCYNLCLANRHTLNDKLGNLSKGRIVQFLNKEKYECNSTHTKLLFEMLSEYQG